MWIVEYKLRSLCLEHGEVIKITGSNHLRVKSDKHASTKALLNNMYKLIVVSPIMF